MGGSGDRLQRSRVTVSGRDFFIMQGVPVLAPLLPQLGDSAWRELEFPGSLGRGVAEREKIGHSAIASAQAADPLRVRQPKTRLIGDGREPVVAESFFPGIAILLAVYLGIDFF